MTSSIASPYCYGSETWTLLTADERRLEAFHMNCQRRIVGIRWFHFVTNASVTSQTGEELGLAIRICRRRLSIFGHVRRLPATTPAHSALRLAVDARAGGKPDYQAGVEAPARTTLPNVDAADRGPHWAQRQRRLEDRTWPQVLEGATRGRSSVPLTDWLTDILVISMRAISMCQFLLQICNCDIVTIISTSECTRWRITSNIGLHVYKTIKTLCFA